MHKEIHVKSETDLEVPTHAENREKTVSVDINGRQYTLREGTHSVASLKTTAGIPLADELEQVVDQRLTPLPDNGVVEVRECQWFVSHPRDCQSS